MGRVCSVYGGEERKGTTWEIQAQMRG